MRKDRQPQQNQLLVKKGIRRSSQNLILFNAEIFDFDGSSGIPFDHRRIVELGQLIIGL
jgi:hypothetical protein